jgi:hypothetical protein
MKPSPVATFLQDIRLKSELQFQLIDAVRAQVKAMGPGFAEEMKYGGVLLSSGPQFCGLFAYREHVSLEFSHGAAIADPWGCLEGAGKGRRHLKLRSLADLQGKQVAGYLPLALAATRAAAR